MRGQWKRGHAARGIGGGQLLEDAPQAPDGVDEAAPTVPPWQNTTGVSGGTPVTGFTVHAADTATPRATGAPDAEPEARPDPPAAPVSGRGRGRGPAPKRITAAVRSDIEGKVGLMLELGGRTWAARDPVCGGAFVQQAPAIRVAVVDLVLMSPDLVAWFTGIGGGFMLWFNLLAALYPVAVTVYGHHVAGTGDEDQAAQHVQYAA